MLPTGLARRNRSTAPGYTTRGGGDDYTDQYEDQQGPGMLPVPPQGPQVQAPAGPQMLPMSPAMFRRKQYQDRQVENRGNFLASVRNNNVASALRRSGQTPQQVAGVQADLLSGGYVTNRQAAIDQNLNRNELARANAGMIGSLTDYNDARSRGVDQDTRTAASLLPMQVRQAQLQNEYGTKMLPVQVEQAQAGVQGQRIQNQNEATYGQFIDPQMRAQIDQQYAQNEATRAGAQQLPALTEAQAGVLRGQANLYDAQAQALQTPIAPQTDPLDQTARALDLTDKMIKAGVAEPAQLPPDGYKQHMMQTGSSQYQQLQKRQTFQGIMQQASGARQVTPQIAQQFLARAGGDKNKARQLARQAGYTF